MSTNQAWVTLATNDSYCLGALVLAQSLKRAHTIYPIAVLITPGVSPAMRELLSTDFDLVQEVNVLDSGDAANLALMARPELGITFTKLHCWTLTQYSKCVFLDADTIVLRNCDELFERDELSAAPDVGWPDCFNSGVFVYKPSDDTYKALLEHAIAHGSFDGGDQGLLNQFFADWATKSIEKHLPFIYNMVSSAFYSYLPAFKKYGANVKIAHFIGGNKPWLSPLPSSSALTSFLDIWWNIFRSDVAHRLNTNMSGLAGALAAGERDEIELQWRKQSWEQGNIDYMGRDSFDNIWKKISETVGLGETLPPKTPPAEASVKLSDILQKSAPTSESQTSESSAQKSAPVTQSSFENALKIVSAASVAVAIPSQPAPETTMVPPIDVTMPTPPPSSTISSSPPIPAAPTTKPLFPPMDAPLATPPPAAVETPITTPAQPAAAPPLVTAAVVPPAQVVTPIATVVPPLAQAPATPPSVAICPEAPATVAICPEAPAAVAICPEAPATVAICPTAPATVAICPTAPAPVAVCPEAPAPIAVCPEAPAPIAVCPEAPAPLAICPEAPAPVAICPTAPAPVAVCPEAPARVAVCPEAPAPVAICPEAPAPVAVCPEAPAPVAICPESPAPIAISPAAPAPVAICPEAPTTPKQQPDKPAQKQAEQGKKGGQKSQQKGGAKQSQQSPPKTPPTEVPSSSPPAAQSPAVPSLSSPAAPEPAHQPESPPQVKPTVQAASAPSPSQTATTPSQVEAAPVPPKRKGNQKSGKGKK